MRTGLRCPDEGRESRTYVLPGAAVQDVELPKREIRDMKRGLQTFAVVVLALLSCGVTQAAEKPSLAETKQYILDKMNALASGTVKVAFDGNSLVFAARDKTYTVPLPDMDPQKIYTLYDSRDRQKCVGFHFKAVSSRKVIKIESKTDGLSYTNEERIQPGFAGPSVDGEKIQQALLHAHRLMGGKKELF